MMNRREFVKLLCLLFVALLLDGWWFIREAVAEKPPLEEKQGSGWAIPWSIPWNVAPPPPLPQKEHVYFMPLIMKKLRRISGGG